MSCFCLLSSFMYMSYKAKQSRTNTDFDCVIIHVLPNKTRMQVRGMIQNNVDLLHLCLSILHEIDLLCSECHALNTNISIILKSLVAIMLYCLFQTFYQHPLYNLYHFNFLASQPFYTILDLSNIKEKCFIACFKHTSYHSMTLFIIFIISHF